MAIVSGSPSIWPEIAQKGQKLQFFQFLEILNQVYLLNYLSDLVLRPLIRTVSVSSTKYCVTSPTRLLWFWYKLAESGEKKGKKGKKSTFPLFSKYGEKCKLSFSDWLF